MHTSTGGVGRVQRSGGGAVCQQRPLPVVADRRRRRHVVLVREHLFDVAHQRYHQRHFADQQRLAAQRGHEHKAHRYQNGRHDHVRAHDDRKYLPVMVSSSSCPNNNNYGNQYFNVIPSVLVTYNVNVYKSKIESMYG